MISVTHKRASSFCPKEEKINCKKHHTLSLLHKNNQPHTLLRRADGSNERLGVCGGGGGG